VKFSKNSENKHRQSVHADTDRKARQHPWITPTMNGRALAILMALASVVTFVSSANADSCKNVDIKLDNQTSVRIKALYVNFKCEGENEKKEMFKNVEVPEQTKLPVATQQDLQSCKGKKMNYIEVHYKVRCGDGSWSNEKFIKDSSFLNPYCSSDAGKEYTVVLPADNPQATCN
jgi:non-homologous end joining protein Ku